VAKKRGSLTWFGEKEIAFSRGKETAAQDNTLFRRRANVPLLAERKRPTTSKQKKKKSCQEDWK